jgi:hypothetical protein
MKRKLWLLALVGAMLLSVSPVLADGDFYVIAGGGGVGTKITSLPYTITQSGFYYLVGALTYNGSTSAITVNCDDVTIDLMGFKLAYTGSNQVYGIAIWGKKNVEVRNGTIRGFYVGVVEPFELQGANHRVINVRAVSNTIPGAYGIALSGNNHLVQGCNASNNAQTGISVDSGVITNSVACNNIDGIQLKGPGSVIGNIANNNTIKNFRLGTFNTKTPIMVDRNSASGLSLNYSVESGSTGIIYGTNAGSP